MLLSDYEYVHQCLKFGTDVHVSMMKLTDAAQTFSYEVNNKLLLLINTVCIYCLFMLVYYHQRRSF